MLCTLAPSSIYISTSPQRIINNQSWVAAARLPSTTTGLFLITGQAVLGMCECVFLKISELSTETILTDLNFNFKYDVTCWMEP